MSYNWYFKIHSLGTNVASLRKPKKRRKSVNTYKIGNVTTASHKNVLRGKAVTFLAPKVLKVLIAIGSACVLPRTFTSALDCSWTKRSCKLFAVIGNSCLNAQNSSIHGIDNPIRGVLMKSAVRNCRHNFSLSSRRK